MIKTLRMLNFVFGAAVLIVGYGGFVLRSSVPALLIALALTIVGPVEDWLMRLYKIPADTRGETKQLIDYSTSLVFVILLLITLLVIP